MAKALISEKIRKNQSKFRWKPIAVALFISTILEKAIRHIATLSTASRSEQEDAPGFNRSTFVSSRVLSEPSHHGSHPHEAMYLLTFLLIVGAGFLHLTTFKALKGLQTTVMLFVFGVILALFMELDGVAEWCGMFGRSYTMWSLIDPHLLLYTLLPPLLAGDAMTIDTQVAQKVSKQCLFLAGPGVAINAFTTAFFLWVYLPYGWDFLLCLTLGSILCATDPVAVVALLKELGASPTLTVQIQGESLLNDGTAIVVYTVTYRILSGIEMDFGDIVQYLVKTAMFAWLFGILIGVIFCRWIQVVANLVDHNNALLQVALTIVCAYGSFVLAEGLFHISGVLATVAASICLAHRMWLDVICHDTMLTIWHMFEYLGNTVIFVLAGLLTGRAVVVIEPTDFLHLFAIYFMLIVIRLALFMTSRPLLTLLHSDRRPVTIEDALIMSWGGLRGAVGLALAIQVNMDRAGGELAQKDVDRVLFFVGGVAALTLLVNATTCPMLVKKLGVTRVSKDRVDILTMAIDRIGQNAVNDVENMHGGPAKNYIKIMVEDVFHHLPKDYTSSTNSEDEGCIIKEDLREMKESQAQYCNLVLHRRDKLLLLIPHSNLIAEYAETVSTNTSKLHCEEQMTESINRIFLNLVMDEYVKLIRTGEVRRSVGELLRHSVFFALGTRCQKLQDFAFLKQCLDEPDCEEMTEENTTTRKNSFHVVSELIQLKAADKSYSVALFLKSGYWMLLIFVAIVVSAYMEYAMDDMPDVGWIVIEFIIFAIFLLEVVLHFVAEKMEYFKSAWNNFNLAMVLVDIVAIVVTLAEIGGDDVSKVRAFRVLKILRVTRMISLIFDFKEKYNSKNANVEVRLHMKLFEVYHSVVLAHLSAIGLMDQFFGICTRGEVLRCIADSMATVYKALKLCAREMSALPEWTCEEQNIGWQAIGLLHVYEKNVEKVEAAGIFSAKQANELVTVLRKHILDYRKRISNIRLGLVDKPLWEFDNELQKIATLKDVKNLYSEHPTIEKPQGKVSALRRMLFSRRTATPTNLKE